MTCKNFGLIRVKHAKFGKVFMIARGHRSFGDHVEIVVQGRQMLRKLRGRGTEHPLHGLTLAHGSFFLLAHGIVPCSLHAVVLTARENAAESDTLY